MSGGQLNLPNLSQLEQHRSQLHDQTAAVGDLRRGSVTATYRRCGKPNCACADPQHPGHGPQHRLTRSVKGKTEAVQLQPGPELEKARREVANYKRFVALGQEIIEVNEQICEARPAMPGEEAAARLEKKGSSRASKRRSVER